MEQRSHEGDDEQWGFGGKIWFGVISEEKSNKQGRKIADIDVDVEVNLENVYNLDIAHEETVSKVVEEIVEVITTAKIIVNEVSTAGRELNAANEEPVSAASTNIITAQPSEATKTTVDITTAPKAKGIVFHDMEESTTRIASSKVQSRQSDAVRKYQALKRKYVAVAQDRKNMMIYLKNMAGFKMDFFKGMSFEDIGPLFEEEYNKVKNLFNEGPEMNAKRVKAPRKRTRKEKVEKDQSAKKKKVHDDKDDVFLNVTPLSSKPPTIMDYKIYKEGKNEHSQIIRANGNYQMYLALNTMLKNFDKEDLEVLWKIVKDMFKESQPKEVLDVFLWHTLKVMFEHFVEDSVRKL
nr:hypothetical protein [Tanacetum cinerariifolium]